MASCMLLSWNANLGSPFPNVDTIGMHKLKLGETGRAERAGRALLRCLFVSEGSGGEEGDKRDGRGCKHRERGDE